MDPIWVMITRYLCHCQPFIELQTHATETPQSLTCKYVSLPPQFAIIKALHLKHFALIAISANALLINVLSVAMSNLFSPEIKLLSRVEAFASMYQPAIQIPTGSFELASYQNSSLGSLPNNYTSQDIYYTAKSYVYDDSRLLPPWTSTEYFFVPFNTTILETTGISSLDAFTIGFRSSLSCEDPSSSDSITVSFGLTNGTYLFGNWVDGVNLLPINITFQDDSSASTTCTSFQYWAGYKLPSFELSVVLANGTTAGELLLPLYTLPEETSSDAVAICASHFLLAWIRAETEVSGKWDWNLLDGRSVLSSVGKYDYSMLVCHQVTEAYNFRVTVSPQGQVLSSIRLSDEIVLSALPTNSLELQTLNSNLLSVPVQSWFTPVGNAQNGLTFHGDSKPKDWFSYIMVGFTKSSSFLNPKEPVPAALSMAGPVSKTWSLLMALLFSKIYSTNSLVVPISPQEEPRALKGHVKYSVTRVQMSKPMFVLAIGILSLNLLTSAAFFIYARRNRLPWVPKSIAAMLAYVAWSEMAMVDVQRTSGMSTSVREKFLKAKGGKYRLGTKARGDGKGQIVIDRAEDVQPFKKQNTGKGKKI